MFSLLHSGSLVLQICGILYWIPFPLVSSLSWGFCCLAEWRSQVGRGHSKSADGRDLEEPEFTRPVWWRGTWAALWVHPRRHQHVQHSGTAVKRFQMCRNQKLDIKRFWTINSSHQWLWLNQKVFLSNPVRKTLFQSPSKVRCLSETGKNVLLSHAAGDCGGGGGCFPQTICRVQLLV